MSEIIEIKYSDIDHSESIIKARLQNDGFVKITFDDSSKFSKIMKATKEYFYLSQLDKNTMLKYKGCLMESVSLFNK